MPQLPNAQPERLDRKPLLLAQAETPAGGAPTGETHAAAESGHGAKHEPGQVPNATLLFANSVTVALILVAFALIVRNRLTAVPRGLASFAELVAEFFRDFTVGIIGPGGEKYTPLVGTVFIYIVMMNLFGQIPGFHSPTANVSITLALGVVVFVYVQYVGIKGNGLGGHIRHFMGPRDMPALAPLMLIIELISELVKPFTLAIRLFGNIFGEDVIILVLAGLAGSLGGALLGWIPLQFPLMVLALLTSFVQALVFAMLTCIYISLVSPHDHGESHDAEAHHGASPAHVAGH